MSNLAFLQHYKTDRQDGGKVAQLEDGYLRIANELVDAVMCAGLSETELCIVLAVWRKTYGYSKKVDWISNVQLSEMIVKHSTHCSSAKNSLIVKKVLIQQGRKVGINTNLAEWVTKNNGFCKTLAKPAKKTLAEVAKRPKQKLLNTKDNITKDNKDNILKPPKSPLHDFKLPDWLPSEIWQSWVAYRKEIKKPIKSEQTVNQSIRLLERGRELGINPESIINASICNGWTGLFLPKDRINSGQPKRTLVADNFGAKDYGLTDTPAWLE